MYKKIIEGETLTITGSNMYPSNTQVFFNTIENPASVLTGSFNENFSEVSIRIPCCLPKLNDIIVYNGINYATGANKYEFFGQPSFSGISDSSVKWGESALVSGSYLSETTGVTVDNQAAEFYVESEGRVVFTMPSTASSGNLRELVVKTTAGQIQTKITVEEPDIDGELTAQSYASGLEFNQSGSVVGTALHRVNRILISGYGGPINIESTNLSYDGNTGITFLVPAPAIGGFPVKLQHQNTFFSGGNSYTNIIEEKTTSQNLKIISPFISNISHASAKYQDSITISGSQVENCKILFSGYNSGYVEGNSVSTGVSTNVISVPRGIMRSQLVASGYTGDVQGKTATSTQHFYPVPTITGVSTTNFTVGETVTIDAVNAAQIRALVAVSGKEKVSELAYSTTDKIYVVSTPSNLDSPVSKDYGYASVDNTSLDSDITTGTTKISATINSHLIGSGVPFLVSSFEGEPLSSLDSFGESLINIPNYDLVTVSGKEPTVIGLSKNRAKSSDTITISGNNLMSIQNVTLTDGVESKIISTGDLNSTSGSISHPFVSFTNTGDNNPHHQTHSINVDLSKFSYLSNSGSFTFTTFNP